MLAGSKLVAEPDSVGLGGLMEFGFEPAVCDQLRTSFRSTGIWLLGPVERASFKIFEKLLTENGKILIQTSR